MEQTCYGHSAFHIRAGEARIFIDPFPGDNPSTDNEWNGDRKGKKSTRGGDR